MAAAVWVQGADRIPQSMQRFFAQPRQRHAPPAAFKANLEEYMHKQAARRSKVEEYKQDRQGDGGRPDANERANYLYTSATDYFTQLLNAYETVKKQVAGRASVVMKAPMHFVIQPPLTNSHMEPNVPPTDHSWLSEGGAKALAGEEAGHLWAGVNTVDLEADDCSGINYRDSYAFVGYEWIAPVDGTIEAKVWLKNWAYSMDLDANPTTPDGDTPFTIHPDQRWFRVSLLGGAVLWPPEWGMPENPGDVWQDPVVHWQTPQDQPPAGTWHFEDEYASPSLVPIWLVHPHDDFEVQKDCHYFLYAGLHSKARVTKAAVQWIHEEDSGNWQTLTCSIMGMGSIWVDRIEVTLTPDG
jgi:hypothetical protein